MLEGRLAYEKVTEIKLASTDKCEVTMYESGGGIKFEFNTDMYDLIKLTVDEFFTSTNAKPRCGKKRTLGRN